MIEICSLTKYYGSTPALQGIDLVVVRGEVLGFLGPNGAGKSTTLRILAGCLAPSSGTARVAGYDIFEQSMEARRSLGYLPEQVPLYPEMTVAEYLAFAGALHSLSGRDLAPRLDEVLARCGLGDVRRKIIGRLSKGYRQRVGLAQALLHNPPVLILDEPTVGLDPRQIVEIREMIQGLAGEHTILLSTHILAEVSMVCTHVAIIHRGRIVAQDTLERLTGEPQKVDRLLLEVEGPQEAIVRCLRAVPGVIEIVPADPAPARGSPGLTCRLAVQTAPGDPSEAREIRRAIASAVVGANHGLLEIRPERQTLEDVFVRVTTMDAETR